MATPNRRETLRQQQAAAQARQARFTRALVIGVAALAVVLIGVFVFVGVQAGKSKAEQAANALTPPNAAAGGIAINPGAPDSAPQVVLYVDYQCPACANFEQAFGGELAKMAAEGEIRYSQVTMTFMDRNIGNDSSTKAANAAVCADEAGAYTDYNQAIFANQAHDGSGYPDQLLRDQLPEQVGISSEGLATFQKCYDGKLGASFVEGMNKFAYDAKVTSTPTITVNGTKIDNATLSSPDALRDQIKALS
jgi:protein-disulfide isomerase